MCISYAIFKIRNNAGSSLHASDIEIPHLTCKVHILPYLFMFSSTRDANKPKPENLSI